MFIMFSWGMKDVTIRELAKLVGTSPATISIVLNKKKGVSEETRRKVLEAVKAHHYTPSTRGTGKAKNVLLLKYCKSGMFVEENQGFISMIIDSIEEQLRMEHLGMTMMVAKTELGAALEAIDYAKHCGMIVIATEIMGDGYADLEKIPIPFIVVDNTVPNCGYSSVCMNNGENVRIALQYCRECGHTEIGYLGSVPGSGAENFNARYTAFCMLVRELGLRFEPQWEFRVTPTMLGAHDDFIGLLEQAPAFPSCFFAENDTIALGVMKAMKEKGYRIPSDVSIIGFDDIPYASISSPTLTTIHVQRNIIGKQSVLQLLQLMEDPRFRLMKTQITGRLMVRDSVKDKRVCKE